MISYTGGGQKKSSPPTKNGLTGSIIAINKKNVNKSYSKEILKHLNSIKPDVIVFTKEDQEAYVLPVLDLKQKVDRKTKRIKCMVYYKKTHTNIIVKEKSNHPPCVKKGIYKGVCDDILSVLSFFKEISLKKTITVGGGVNINGMYCTIFSKVLCFQLCSHPLPLRGQCYANQF